MTAQGPWKMSRSSINIRQVSIIVCPFSSALIYAISEMWKRQIIWGCGRRWTLFSFNQDTSDEFFRETWHSALALWIFCQGCYYFHYHLIKVRCYFTWDSNSTLHAHTHTHTEGGRKTPVNCKCCKDTGVYSAGCYLTSISQPLQWDLQLMSKCKQLSISLSTVCTLTQEITHTQARTHTHTNKATASYMVCTEQDLGKYKNMQTMAF